MIAAPRCTCDSPMLLSRDLDHCPVHGTRDTRDALILADEQIKQLRGDLVTVVMEQERLRSALRFFSADVYRAASLLTPGLKAGVGEVKARLLAAHAKAQTELHPEKETSDDQC